MKKYGSLVLAASLAWSAAAVPAGAEAEKVDYVALGDSIASGQTPYGAKVGISYTDLIAQRLQAEGVLASFKKEFAMSGETSTQFLAKLTLPDVQAAIKEAELLTVSTGANDLIQLVRSGSTSADAVLQTLAQVDRNITTGIRQINELNPSLDVYITGYYFPFPTMPEGAEKENLKAGFALFNNQLKTTAEQQGAVFVEVADKFSADFLPNPYDIHPNEAGYRLIADQFFAVWEGNGDLPEDPFSDIGTTGSEARTAIIGLAEAGILSGNPDGTFAPKSSITRAEAAIILARTLRETGTAPNPGFSDVSAGMKSYEAIAALTKAGIFSEAPRFNPDRPLTRAQMARVLTQALQLETNASVSFSDVPAAHWAKEEIAAVAASGIMNGGSSSRFLPEHNITREQFAMTIYNAWSQLVPVQ